MSHTKSRFQRTLEISEYAHPQNGIPGKRDIRANTLVLNERMKDTTETVVNPI